MLILVILFYLSDPKNKLNRWCSVGGFFFWVGIVKQAIPFEIFPWLQNSFGISGLDAGFAPVHAFLTWMIYALATPTLAVAGLYFGSVDKEFPERMRWLKLAIFAPAAVLLFFFPPLRFRELQLTSRAFWVVYTVYNFFYAFVLTGMASRGVRIERQNTVRTQKNLKLHVARILLPPMFYWLVSIFVVHLLNIFGLFELSRYLDIWQFNVFIVLLCIIIFITSAFRDGFMGLKIVTQKSDWHSNMSNINLNAAHAIHVLNTHTVNMKSSIYLLEKYNRQTPDCEYSGKVSERLEILSKSISYLEDYFDRTKSHTESISLKGEAPWKVAEMLCVAASAVRDIYPGLSVEINVLAPDALFCDRVHMTETFVNIIKNAAEAMQGAGAVEIAGALNKTPLKRHYKLQFRDHGDGIDTGSVDDVFRPYSSSKNKDKNLGLGLSYCRSVVIAHGGRIFVEESVRGAGTVIGINFPARRVSEAE